MAKSKAKPKKPAAKATKKSTKKPAAKKAAKPAKKAAKPAQKAAKPAKQPARSSPAAPAAAAVAPAAAIAATPVATPPALTKPAKVAKPAKTPNIKTQRKQLLDDKTIPELRVMLKRNDQITTGDKGKLVKRILDGIEHGALPRCPSCGLGRLKASKYSGFRCPGGYDDDEYMFCGFTAGIDDIQRPAWQFETPGGLV